MLLPNLFKPIYIYIERRERKYSGGFCSSQSTFAAHAVGNVSLYPFTYILPRPYFSLSVDFPFPFYGGGSRLFHPHWPLGKGRDTGAAALYMICIGDGNENRKKGGARDKGIYVGVRRYKC